MSALLGALLMSFTLVPALGYLALRKPRVQRESPLLRWVQRAFDPAIRTAMRNPAAVLITALGLLIASLMLVLAIRSRLENGEALERACESGTRERLRAVLMTALLASLGLLPAALSHAIGSETQRPIAVVVVTGTVSAALVTLVVLPVAYALACRVREALGVRGGAVAPSTGA